MCPSDFRVATHSFKKLRNVDTSESSSRLQVHSEIFCTMSMFRSQWGILVKLVSFVMSSYSVNTTPVTSSRLSSKCFFFFFFLPHAAQSKSNRRILCVSGSMSRFRGAMSWCMIPSSRFRKSTSWISCCIHSNRKGTFGLTRVPPGMYFIVNPITRDSTSPRTTRSNGTMF